MQNATQRTLTKAELKAYDAPFPSEEYKCASRVMPRRVPITYDMPSVLENMAAMKILKTWTKPFLTLFSDGDFVTKPEMGENWARVIPGASGVKHEVIKNAGHFVQEDKGEELAEKVIQFIRDWPFDNSK